MELKHKVKVMTLQIEQLKEDIAGKEMQLIREQLGESKSQSILSVSHLVMGGCRATTHSAQCQVL